VGVTLRPRKVLYVTAGLRGGGAEAMLARLASAQPGVADDITIVSLLPAEAHMERLRAGDVRVVELRFDKAGGIATGLFKLARLIAESRPDIVQGWMYHGDLAALVALVLSRQRRQTRLIWSIRCVDTMKDHGSFLAAMAKLPDLSAVLLGAGTENLPAARNVRRLGRRHDVARLFAAADFVVSSSRFGEGFSNVLAEGMACGLPAVATDVGDAKLIVGDTGIVVPPESPDALAAAIRTLAAESAPLRAERGRKARARIVENFAMPHAVQRYVDLYESLGSSPR
jgi:hypothetical protein